LAEAGRRDMTVVTSRAGFVKLIAIRMREAKLLLDKKD
jgi:hypothetical protein